MTATTNGESMGRGKGEVLFSDEPFKTTGAAIGAGVLTGSLITCIMLVIAIIIGSALQGMDEGMAYCLSFIAAGIAGGVLQQLWFNLRATVLRLRYPLRLLGFSLSYYICLAACAFLGRWLPSTPGAWATFTAIFLVILLVLTVVLTRVFHRREGEYGCKLGEYRQARHG